MMIYKSLFFFFFSLTCRIIDQSFVDIAGVNERRCFISLN